METVRIWDPWLRISHWLLAVATIGAYFIPAQPLYRHAIAGYTALVLVGLRIVWGFVGSEHARFASFVPSRAQLFTYIGALVRCREPRTLGHNPTGAMMMLLLLGSILALGISGWMLTRPAWRDARWIEDAHVLLAHAVLGACALHVLGVLYTSLRHRENLIVAMITGRKRR